MPVGTILLDPYQAFYVKQHPGNNAVFMARNGPKQYGYNSQTPFLSKQDNKTFHIRFGQALKRLNNCVANEQDSSFRSSFDVYSSNHLGQNRKDDRILERTVDLRNYDGSLLPPVILKKPKKKIYRTSMFHNLPKLSQITDPLLDEKKDVLPLVSENDEQEARTIGLCPPPSPSEERFIVQLSQRDLPHKSDQDGQVPYRLPALDKNHLFNGSIKYRYSRQTKSSDVSMDSNSVLSNYLYS